MKTTTKCVIAFAAGAVAGFFGGFAYCRQKNDQYIHEQIADGIAEMYGNFDKVSAQFGEDRKAEKKPEPQYEMEEEEPFDYSSQYVRKEGLNDYLQRVHAEQYIEPSKLSELPDSYRNIRGENKKEEMKRRANAKPYQIMREDFGRPPDHEIVGFELYSDGVLCDDANDIIDDPEDTIGCSIADLMDMIAIVEDKTLHFRNERTQLDIEVTWNEKTHAQLLEERPYLKEDI